jgi:hypothetical protein
VSWIHSFRYTVTFPGVIPVFLSGLIQTQRLLAT